MTNPQSTITQDEYDALKVTLAERDKQIEQLRKLVKYAYEDGFKEGFDGFGWWPICEKHWPNSFARAALQAGEGE